jgi:hypothetical protein
MDYRFRLDHSYRGQSSLSCERDSRPGDLQLPRLCAPKMARNFDYVGLHRRTRVVESLVQETAQHCRDDRWYLSCNIFHLLGHHIGCSSPTQHH